MTIGIRKETKNHEYRVALMPKQIDELNSEVWVEDNAGLASGFTNAEYERNGAIIKSRAEIFKTDIIIGVKELIDEELDSLLENQTDICFQHYAAHNRKAKCKQYAYEEFYIDMVPAILKPMSLIAGKIAVLEGIKYLFSNNGGLGILPCGLPDYNVAPAKVLVVGAGVSGMSAVEMAIGVGANVTVVDTSYDRIASASKIVNAKIEMPILKDFDLIISTVYVPGSKAPTVIDTHLMKPGAVFVDVSIDQGGSSETSRPTTHDAPTYIENDVIHYCVPNIPGIVGNSATKALCDVSLGFIRQIAHGQIGS